MEACDIRSTICSDLSLIRTETNLDPWTTDKSTLHNVLAYQEKESIPEGEEWKCIYLHKLLEQTLTAHYNGAELSLTHN